MFDDTDSLDSEYEYVELKEVSDWFDSSAVYPNICLRLPRTLSSLQPLVPKHPSSQSILTTINRALASPGWPANDAALPFTLPRDGSGTGSQSQARKRPREDDGTADSDDTEGAGGSDLPVHPAKKTQPGPSPLRKEIAGDPFE